MSELVKSLIAARKEMTSAKKGKDNPFFKSKYADLASVIEAVKEALEAHQLSFVQDITFNEHGQPHVVTVILHESGESLKLAPFPIIAAKQDAQGFGSANPYARRYSLQTALGVPAEDDDGNAASQPQKKFPSPVTSAMEGVELTPEQQKIVADVRAALLDLYEQNAGGVDVTYSVIETMEPLDSDLRLGVWKAMAKESTARAWVKKVQADHAKVAA